MPTISEDQNWMYLEDEDAANLPSFRHFCLRCGVTFTGDMVAMGMLKIHDDWHESLEKR